MSVTPSHRAVYSFCSRARQIKGGIDMDQTTIIIALASFIAGMCTALSFNQR